MTTCPNNVWNHTNGCFCVANGPALAEADVDILPRRLIPAHEYGIDADPELEFVTDEGADVVIVTPEDGDGETFYWETQLNGHIWDGRCDTREEAAEEARYASVRMSDLDLLDDPDTEW